MAKQETRLVAVLQPRPGKRGLVQPRVELKTLDGQGAEETRAAIVSGKSKSTWLETAEGRWLNTDAVLFLEVCTYVRGRLTKRS